MKSGYFIWHITKCHCRASCSVAKQFIVVTVAAKIMAAFAKSSRHKYLLPLQMYHLNLIPTPLHLTGPETHSPSTLTICTPQV